MNILRRFVFILIVVILLSSVVLADSNKLSINEPVKIRVLLSNNTNTIIFSVVSGSYEIIDESSGKVLTNSLSGELWNIKLSNSGNLSFGIEGEKKFSVNNTLFIKPVNKEKNNIFRYSGMRYRGGLRVSVKNGKLYAVNVVNIEKYLYGVVGKEIGTSAKYEALKAQAVVSRSYALSKYNKLNDYDVGVDTSTQVYEGYEAELLYRGDKVIQAVDETKSEVLFYNNKIVTAFFHSNSGGYTANSEDVWGGHIPYLRSIPSPFDSYALKYPNQSKSGWPGSTYKWNKVLLKKDLLKCIEDWNLKSNTEDKISVGNVLGVKALNFNNDDYNHRKINLEIIGTQGEKIIFGNKMRWLLGLKSTNYNLITDATIYILADKNESIVRCHENNLKVVSAGNIVSKISQGKDRYTVVGANTMRTVQKNVTKIEIDGYGYGHGLGMSQWGARGMAAQGYNYRDILEYYYNQGKYDGKLVIKSY